MVKLLHVHDEVAARLAEILREEAARQRTLANRYPLFSDERYHGEERRAAGFFGGLARELEEDPADRPDEPMLGGPHEIEGQYRGEPSRDPRQ